MLRLDPVRLDPVHISLYKLVAGMYPRVGKYYLEKSNNSDFDTFLD